MAGGLPDNFDDAKRLRRELERVARETIPELKEALRADASEDTLVDLLAGRMQGGIGGQLVDVPDSLVAAPAQAPAAASDNGSDIAGLAASVAGIQAQVILIQATLDEIRDIARAWADAQGVGT